MPRPILRRFLHIWAAVLTVCLCVQAYSMLQKGIVTYAFSDMFINYSGGFVRRGLLGSILLWLNAAGIDPVAAAMTVCIAAFAAVAAYIIRQFIHRGYDVALLPVCFLLGSAGAYGFSFLRRDFIILAAFLIIMQLRKKLPHVWWIAAGNALSVITILTYEPFVFFSLPFFILTTRLHTRSWLRSVAYWIPSAAAFLVCCKFSGDKAVYDAIWASVSGILPNPGIMDFFLKGSFDVMKFHAKMNFFKADCCVPNLMTSLVSLIAIVYYCINAVPQFARRRIPNTFRPRMLLLLLCAILGQAPMFICLSTDYSRMFVYATVSAFIMLFSLSEEESGKLFPPACHSLADRLLLRFDRILPPSQAGIILVMLFIGVAAWTSLGITDFMQKSGIGVVWRTATLLFY